MDERGRWTLLLGEYGNSVRVTQRKPSGMFVRIAHISGGHKTQGSLHTNDRHEARLRAEAFYRSLVGIVGGTNNASGEPAAATTSFIDMPITLGEIWKRYREEGDYQDNATKTQKDKDARAEILLAGLGADTIAAYLTVQDVNQYQRKRRTGHQWTKDLVTEPVGSSSIGADLRFLRSLLLWATKVRNRQTGTWLLEAYPLRELKIPKEKNPRRVATTYERFQRTRKACQKLRVQAYKKQGRQKWLRLELALVLAEATGRRIGAIAGLRWDDITLDDSLVRITWREEFDKDATLRVVTAPENLACRLRVFRSLLQVKGDEWVFPNRSGTGPWSKDLFDQALRKAEKEAGLPSLDGTLWHAYRRKWVTERKAAGWSLIDIAAVGGWKNVQVLEECYALEDEETMLGVMAEPTKLHGPLTGVVKNSGRIATPQNSRPAVNQTPAKSAGRSVA